MFEGKPESMMLECIMLTNLILTFVPREILKKLVVHLYLDVVLNQFVLGLLYSTTCLHPLCYTCDVRTECMHIMEHLMLPSDSCTQ